MIYYMLRQYLGIIIFTYGSYQLIRNEILHDAIFNPNHQYYDQFRNFCLIETYSGLRAEL